MAREGRKAKKDRAKRLVLGLKALYPEAECTLDYQSDWQLLVAAILAAQCTDARVNRITAKLFVDFPSLEALALASQETMEAAVRTSGLYRNKAKHIRQTAALLISDFGGKVPSEMDALLSLPGVGRKIANLMRGDFFRIPGIVVDTHCGRISTLMGLASGKSPAAIEQSLSLVLAQEDWISYGHLMVAHGRERCQARKRHCAACPLDLDCRYGQAQRDAIVLARAAGDVTGGF